jgi:hypothetical protein
MSNLPQPGPDEFCSEPEPGVYLARATSDTGDQAPSAAGRAPPYEAACDALATITPSIDPTTDA